MLNEIHNFCVTAECLNFTKAAKFLYIEQPALSKQISRLEEELGVRLFKRTTRRVSLTPAGEAFLQICQNFINACNMLPKSFPHNSICGNVQGLVIGIGETIESEVIISALAGFFETHEGVALSFIRKNDEELPDLLISEDADFIYTFSSIVRDRPGFDYLTIKKVRLKVLMWKDHPLAKKERIYFNDLKDEFFVVNTSAPPMLTRMLHRLYEANGVFPKISARVDSPQLSMIMTSAKQGLTITTFFESDLEIASNLVIREIEADGVPTEILENELVLAWRKDMYKKSELIKQFVDSIRESVGS